MITTRDFHKFHKARLRKEIDAETAHLESFISTKRYLVKKLQTYSEVLMQIGLTVEDIAKASSRFVLQNFDNCVFVLTTEKHGTYNLKNLTSITRSIIACNKLIKRANSKIASKKAEFVNKDIFTKVIKIFNREVANAIIYKGYEFHFGFGVSSILVRKAPRNAERKYIDWGASYKAKKEIIARGGIPREGDNGGENWFVYYTNDVECWLHWRRTKTRTVNATYYTYIPTNGDNGMRKLLNKAKKDPNVFILYQDKVVRQTENVLQNSIQ